MIYDNLLSLIAYAEPCQHYVYRIFIQGISIFFLHQLILQTFDTLRKEETQSSTERHEIRKLCVFVSHNILIENNLESTRYMITDYSKNL